MTLRRFRQPLIIVSNGVVPAIFRAKSQATSA